MRRSRVLPPCTVCGATASGFHYGVNSCEACKAFFRRTLSKGIEYECPAKEACDVSFETRNVCAFCRYQKCLKVGMCKNAIKIGRYSHEQRASNIRQIRKLRALSDQESDASSVTTLSEISSPNSLASVDLMSDVWSKTEPESNEFIQQITSELDSATQCLVNNNFENEVFYNQMDCVIEDLNACSVSQVNNELFNEEKSKILEDFIQNLTELHLKYMCENEAELGETLSDMEMERLELIELKQKIFGSLKPMPADEFRKFYNLTGLDIDGRLELIESGFLPRMDESLRRMIAFAKSIPLFNNICLADQVELIKSARCDAFMISRHRYFRPEYKLFKPCKDVVVHIDDITKIKGEIADHLFVLQEKLRKLQLVQEETAILSALSLMSPDGCVLQDVQLVEQHQDFLVDCLLYSFNKNHPHEKMILSKTVDYLIGLRDMREEHFKLEDQLTSWWLGIITFPPLLAELWTSRK